MNLQEQVIQRVLKADADTLKIILELLRKNGGNGNEKKADPSGPSEKTFKAVGFGILKKAIPPDMSSVEWVQRVRSSYRHST